MVNLAEIIQKWFELVAVYDADKQDNLFSSIRTYNERLRKALELDESGITAVMIAGNVLSDYLENRQLPLKEISGLVDELFSHPERSVDEFARQTKNRLVKFLRLYHDLNALLRDEEVESQLQRFQDALIKSLRESGFYSRKVGALIKDRYHLAEVRLSALNAFNRLKVSQFSQGRPGGQEKPAFTDEIFEFYDLNLLLRQMAHPAVKDGIYMCLVRDVQHEDYSYFVFAIKNGENFWLVNDKPDQPSPNYKNLGRRAARDRAFEERIESYLFPYELMGVEYDPELAKYTIRHDTYTQAIRSFQPHWRTIGKISATEPDTLTWVFMLFSLFQHRFFGKTPYQADQLSHSVMMIEPPGTEANKNALLVLEPGALVQYQPLRFQPITSAVLTNENPEVAAAWERPSTGEKEWMEKRYGGQVTDEALLNLLAAPGEGPRFIGEDNLPVPADKADDFFYRHHHIVRSLDALEMTEFGTAEELRKKQIWFARRNQATAIQNLANKEYEERKDEIRAWYEAKVEANLPALRQAIARGEFLSLVTRATSGFSRNIPLVKENILSIQHIKDFSGHWKAVRLAGPSTGRYIGPTCYFTDVKPSIVAVFTANDSTTIADLCGCKVDELPEVLQHIIHHEKYIGNSRLDVIDPLDTLKNPWKDMGFDVVIYLGKKAYAAICKEFGTQPQKIEPRKGKQE